jgi:epoxide hydrolase-like predicted phosphatase
MGQSASNNNVDLIALKGMLGMAIRAVAFDIGGVLEITPDTGMTEKWEQHLHLKPGELDQRMAGVWRDGSLGNCSEEHVQQSLKEIIGMDQAQVDAFLHDLWEEYLGTLNVELAAYFSSLRPRYQTAIISNSFVGARTREQERYHFDKMTDLIIYSHEVGIAKPDRRIYELTCERLGVQPAEMIFLDDHERPVAAAREFGIHAILFQNAAQAIADIQACLQEHAS